VHWLNGLPEVRDTIELHFDARPINEQNLSDWKQRGYREWLQHKESCDLVQRLAEAGGRPGTGHSVRFENILSTRGRYQPTESTPINPNQASLAILLTQPAPRGWGQSEDFRLR
jgi:hypothetical protein